MKSKMQMLYIRLENEINKDLNSYFQYGDQAEEKKTKIKEIKELIKSEEKRIKNYWK